MSERPTTGDRRAQQVAVFGLLLQLAAFGVLAAISLWADSDAIAAVSRLVLVGVPIWLALLLMLVQLRRVQAEALETQALKHDQEAGGGTALFELDDEALLLEQNRLRWLVQWILPATTIVAALICLVGHFVAWGWSLNEAFSADALSRTQRPTLIMWFVVGVGFLCFLCARYTVALSRLRGWRLLHAGAGCMVGNAAACLALAVGLMAGTTLEWAEPLIAYLIRITILVLGAEFAANFILNLYRPRLPGEVPRPSFDSRLFGLMTEPGGLAKSVAEALNYQFGFEVSATWFYQLLQRWLFPIAVFTFAAILLLSSVVVVDADEQVVVEHFGKLTNEDNPVLEPGLHFKWPYPIEVVHRAPVKRISELVVGEATEDEDSHEHGAVVWTEAHEFVPELILLVASPRLAQQTSAQGSGSNVGDEADETQSVAVSLLMASVPIEYRIKDIMKYLYGYDDPEKLLEVVANQYVSDYAASVDIDELIGPGREAFNRDLKKLIQHRLDELDVGIEIVFAGVRGAHPPAKSGVASAFQQVVSAETSMAATINAADGEARRILTSVAGTVTRAKALDQAILARDQLRRNEDADKAPLVEADRRIGAFLMGDAEKNIAPLSGQAASIIADARAAASRLVSDVASRARAFNTQVAAYEAAPELFKHRKRLEQFERLGRVRKYLVVGDASNVIIDYQTYQEGAAMDQILTEGIESQK